MERLAHMAAALFLLLFLSAACSKPESGFVIPVPVPGGSSGSGNGSGSGGGNGGNGGNGGSGGGQETPPSTLCSDIGQTPVVLAYFTEYTETLPEVTLLTHINYAHGRFTNPKTGDGGIVITESKKAPISSVVALKGKNPRLKVMLMIGGWGAHADGFSEMAKSDAKRTAFCQSVKSLLDKHKLDGFDIDWEYPTYAAKDGDHVNAASPADWENFVTLFKEMREAMPDKILSYAASDSGKYTDNYGVLPYIDYINVMTYDEGNPPYHNAPLYRSSITGSRCCAEAIDDIFHGQQKIPYQMMNFGLAFYGHGDGYKLKTGNRYPASVDYSKLNDIFFKGTCDGYDVKGVNYRIWDDVAKVPYLADALGKMYASYEDIESINAKVEYLKSRNMLGAMIWEYRHDDDAGTLRHAVKHAMDGTPDAPGKYERPEEYHPKEVPVMGKVEFSRKLQSGSAIVEELSGLCLSKDGDFLWGVGDNGALYKINFDGTFTQHWTYEADMEGLCMDPATGTMYMAIEPKRVYSLAAPYQAKTTLWDVAEAESMGNSGIEGIAWHKGNLYLGSQTGATLWEYALDGTRLWKRSLRDVTPTISEIAGLDYDAQNDWLWVIDSNSNKDNPQYLGYTVYLFNGNATELLATYYVGDFANWNPESICVDRAHGCIWIADDCGDATPSILHKVLFSGL